MRPDIADEISQFSVISLRNTIEQFKDQIQTQLIAKYREQKSLLRKEQGEGHEVLMRMFRVSRLEELRNFAGWAVERGLVAQVDFSNMVKILNEQTPEISIEEIENIVLALELSDVQPAEPAPLRAVLAAQAPAVAEPVAPSLPAPKLNTDNELRARLSRLLGRDVNVFAQWSRERLEATLARTTRY